ncbi:MAG: M28 family peptidase [Anaerolineales bacterium]|nr:M28 family peptidase [Anaerolineales bacterium]
MNNQIDTFRNTRPPINKVLAGLGILLVLLISTWFVLDTMFPRSVTQASASVAVFSGERAMKHLPVIAHEPHPQGSSAQARVRDYLVEQLSTLGLETEIQRSGSLENVVARLHGSKPTGAIVVLAHYDSTKASPGAVDNGSGVAVLLEVMRALTAGPTPHNDVIALFDDGEELPDPYTGAKLFVREHPWMSDVQVVISLDTAIGGPITTNETGPQNGLLVQAMARAYTGGVWTSFSGGGNYDYTPFRDAGIQGLALEDNYPFREQHTAFDLPEIVNAGSVQQMGEQTLSIVRELGGLDLTNPWGEHETWFSIPAILVHYPEAWALPLAITAGVMLVLALGLTLWRGYVTWRGLVVGFGAILSTAVVAGFATGALFDRVPDLAGWDTQLWPEWPEVIPPNGGLYFAGLGLIVLVLVIIVYRVLRRWCGRPDFSVSVLPPFLVAAVALGVALPRTAYMPTWIVLVGSLAWIAAAMAGKARRVWSVDLAALLEAVGFLLLLFPFLPGVFMSDGFKSITILAGFWAMILFATLPVVEGAMTHLRSASQTPHLTVNEADGKQRSIPLEWSP